MNLFVVALDLHEKSESNYHEIIKEIKKYHNHFEFQRSCWLIETDDDKDFIREYLRKSINTDVDKLFVGELSGASWVDSDGGKLNGFLSQVFEVIEE